MLEKEFIPYTEALTLKELGFDKPCFGAFIGKQFKNFNFSNDIEGYANDNNLIIGAPTFSQSFRWFREKYDWYHSINPTADQHRFEVGHNYWIWNSKTGEEYHTIPKNRPTGDWEYESYEEAELECLRKLIQIVKGIKFGNE
jgi:hypothetical protein